MTEAPISPLRRRMIEDMTIRKFAPRTQEGYIRAVKGLQRLPRRLAGQGELRGFTPLSTASRRERRRRADDQPHRDRAAVSLPGDAAQGARRRPFTFIRDPRKLSLVPSPEEVARLLDAAPGLKYKTALSVA